MTPIPSHRALPTVGPLSSKLLPGTRRSKRSLQASKLHSLEPRQHGSHNDLQLSNIILYLLFFYVFSNHFVDLKGQGFSTCCSNIPVASPPGFPKWTQHPVSFIKNRSRKILNGGISFHKLPGENERVVSQVARFQTDIPESHQSSSTNQCRFHESPSTNPNNALQFARILPESNGLLGSVG